VSPKVDKWGIGSCHDDEGGFHGGQSCASDINLESIAFGCFQDYLCVCLLSTINASM